MSTVSDVINNIRLNLSDESGSRWTDANLLALVKKSIERMNHLLMKNGVQFAKADAHTFSTVDGTSLYNLPSDYMAPADGLFRRDWSVPLDQCTDEEWEGIPSATPTTCWRVNGTQMEIAGTPDASVSMALYYWPIIDTSAYSTSTTMPWSSRMDTPIEEYATIRCMNIDEMDVSADVQLLTDITNNFIGNFATNTPNVSQVAGWFPYEAN